MAAFDRVEGLEIDGKIIENSMLFKYDIFLLPHTYPYEIIDEFNDGYARVKRDGLWGYINIYGEEIIPCIYKSLGYFDQLVTYAEEPGTGLLGLIDIKNNIVLDFEFKDILPNKEGITPVCDSDGLWSVLDSNYEPLTEEYFMDVKPCSEGRIFVKSIETALWSLIDDKGNCIVKDRFLDVVPFSEGLAAVQSKKNGLWGYVDLNGELQIQYIFQVANSFDGGSASAKLDEKTVILDKTGEVTTELDGDIEYYDTENDDDFDDEEESKTEVLIYGNKYIIKNLTQDEHIRTSMLEDGYSEYVDQFYEPIISDKYESAVNIGGRSFLANQGDKIGLYYQGTLVTYGIYKYDPKTRKMINFRYMKIIDNKLFAYDQETKYGLRCYEDGTIEWFDSLKEREDFYDKYNYSAYASEMNKVYIYHG